MKKVHVLLAHRYLYYVVKKPIISDEQYNTWKSEEIEYGPGAPLLEPASNRPTDYPEHIRMLALYFLFQTPEYTVK